MSDVDEIKSKLDIVDIISEYVQLKKAGTNWKANCPFHHEKTPSFMVSKDRQIFKCFGCGESGDIFSFLMKIEGYDFPEALKVLADKAGVKIHRQNPKLASQKNRLLEIVEITANFWHKILMDSSEGSVARNYLKERKISEDTIEEFKIGYAPNSWDATSKFLLNRGFKENEIFLAGLLVKKERGSGFYDRFRNRLMFPIADYHGSEVGFGGRVLGMEKEAKYINSPQSAIYNKSQIIYNLDKAKIKIKEEDLTVMVEGYFDVIASWQAGVKNVVASSGTALSADQIKILKRYSENMAIAFDADAAGESASDRGIDTALKEDLNVKVITLPFGKDPDECVKKDAASWERAVKSAKPIMDHYFEKVFFQYSPDDVAKKRKAAAVLLNKISKIANPIEKNHWLQQLAAKIDVPEFTLREMLYKKEPKKTIGAGQNETIQDKNQNKSVVLEERILALALKYFNSAPNIMDHLEPDFITDKKINLLYKKLIIYYTENNIKENEEGFNLEKFKLYLSNQNNQESDKKLSDYCDVLILLAEKDFLDFEEQAINNEITQVIKIIKKQFLQKKLKQVERDLIAVEKNNQRDKSENLMKKVGDIIREINLLG